MSQDSWVTYQLWANELLEWEIQNINPDEDVEEGFSDDEYTEVASQMPQLCRKVKCQQPFPAPNKRIKLMKQQEQQ